MVEIDGKYYIIDLDKLMAWIVETPTNEKNITTMTTMSYPISNDDEDEIAQKEVSETKSTLNEIMNNVRYDFVRILLNTLFTTFTTELNQVLTFSFKDLSFAQKIAFNTLMAKKIITEVTDFNND